MWTSRVTAFTITHRDDRWLMLRHRRLGVVRWEVPGGHVEAGESLEQAAARETLEETGVAVEVGALVATCVHEWAERRQRRLIAFFAATPREQPEVAGSAPDVLTAPDVSTGPAETDVLEVGWRDPRTLDHDDVSAFLHPLIGALPVLLHDNEPPLHFRATHGAYADGSIGPVIDVRP